MACCCSRSKKTLESTSHPLEWQVKHINMTKLRQVNIPMSILYFEKPSTSHWLNMSINKVKGSPLCAFTVWGPVCSAGLYIAHIMACLALLKRLSRFLWSEDVVVGWDICTNVLSLIAFLEHLVKWARCAPQKMVLDQILWGIQFMWKCAVK